ncbi:MULTISPECIES: TCR/Tet family MFS transporter [Acidiphilium]|jgi:DHA1 family tetracycline resistance protein-like MFS transporter|uniref:Putative major facilitator superfamily transporter n=2 Tax=Acidiphilium TaxID=522 RepID=F0J6H9_ACIMA|nr:MULTISPECIES: tetracycline resistance MFS efflux pump [Acidiphilium]MDE2328547.1 tetracycline resistance MFS efflux pump [Rhodospirillales bacterium]EGO96569.1 Major facilitator transporter [Acidiphilium sp. PM]KDM66943.1 tetracycline resistance protein, class C [Acidiphilium sp. JA12-A1]MBS3022780.1 tetracycline resistance MFS efflux pump [Acidiphilium multivorum]UNC14520.1 tetracycline resistance MFS efflux pump [Acidiphilium multivorum]
MGFIFAVLVIDSIGFGLIAPILPDLVEKLSATPASHAALWVGVLSMTFAATQFFAAPVLGQLSDRFGRRRLILVSLAGSAANYLLLAFAPNLLWLFVGRLIAGATAGNVSAASAYIADITPPERRAQRFGLIGAAFGLGFTTGPVIGGFLGAIDLRLPFLVSAGLVAVNVVYGIFVLPESLPPERRRPFRLREATPLGAMRLLTTVPRLWRLAAAWSVRWFGLGAIQAVFVLYASLRFGWGPRENGIFFACTGIASTLVQFGLVRRAVTLLGERGAAFVGFACNAAAYMIFGVAPTASWLFAGVGLMALGSIANPAIRSMLSRAAPADQQGRMNGALSSIEGLTAIVAPLTGAAVFEAFSGVLPWRFPGAPFVMVAVMLAGAAMLVWSVKPVQAAPEIAPSPARN